MHWIEDLSKVNDSLHHIHASVLLHGWSHFSASIDASLQIEASVVLNAYVQVSATGRSGVSVQHSTT